MTLGYLVNTYPRASHSFIRREIAALERLGWQVQRFAMRSDRAALVEPADLQEDLRTEHLLDAGLPRLARLALGWVWRRPLALAAGLRLALGCGARGAGGAAGTGGRLRHLVYLAEAAALAQRCQDLGVTHLHAHFGTNSATVAMLCAALGGPGYSFTTHGPEEFDAPLALSLAEKLRRARFAVAISSFGRSQLCRWVEPAVWPRVKVIHCGIEPARFGPLPLPEGGPHMIAIGRLVPQKGFALLVDALAMLTDLPDLRIAIVGDGPLRAELEDQANGRVTFLGWQDEDGVRAALGAAQALISPSFAEGLPVVLMEAMATARPVIATAIAGVPELVVPGVGWMVPAGDAAALAKAIRALAATPANQLAQMGAQARDRVLARHDIDTEAGKLSDLLLAVGAKKGAT